jgi:hypothetical protein
LDGRNQEIGRRHERECWVGWKRQEIHIISLRMTASSVPNSSIHPIHGYIRPDGGVLKPLWIGYPSIQSIQWIDAWMRLSYAVMVVISLRKNHN